MIHNVLHDLLYGAALFGWGAGTVIMLFWVTAPIERVWLRLRRNSRLDYERYQAEETIRAIKRRAVHDMLTAEREHRNLGGSGEIIEGTAIEVRR